jgi:hypothetical protein
MRAIATPLQSNGSQWLVREMKWIHASRPKSKAHMSRNYRASAGMLYYVLLECFSFNLQLNLITNTG